MKIAVYPGSFDPVTFGHLDVIERACKIFDKVYISVLSNANKKPHFSLEDRILMLKESLKGRKKVIVEDFKGLLVDYAKERGACAIIRGLRAISDFDFEFQMALTNARMNPDIETVFFMTGYKYSYLSSSLILQIASLGGSVGEFVPKSVEKRLNEGK